MSRTRHDEFGKQLLQTWLAPLGHILVGEPFKGEVRYGDVTFHPTGGVVNAKARSGLLGRLAETPALFELYRNPPSDLDIQACLMKLFEWRAALARRARTSATRDTASLPRLWIVTPTASPALLRGFGARSIKGWPASIKAMPERMRASIVVVHTLPATRATLALRLLGRGEVQRKAMDEVGRLEDDELRRATLEAVARCYIVYERVAQPSDDEREFVMNAEQLYQQWERRVLREGKAEGKVEGKAEGKAEGLREAVGDVCELLGIPLGASRRRVLAGLDAAALEALRVELKRTRAWPAKLSTKTRRATRSR